MDKLKSLLFLLLISVPIVVLFGCNPQSSAKDTDQILEENSKEVQENSTEKANVPEASPEGFRVWTIGVGSPSTHADKTWPSTIVQYKNEYFLVDCGHGCTHGMAKAGIQPYDIENILFTHHHADHNTDFLSILIAGWASHDPRSELNLIGPEGTQKFYDFVLDFYGEDIQYRMDAGFTGPEGILENVEITEVDGGEEMELHGVKISTIEVPHTIQTVAYKFEADGNSVVISEDTTFSEDLIEFSKDADLVVMDGMLAEVKQDDPHYEIFQQLKGNLQHGHISLEEIGKTAAEANYKKLVLTHLFNGEMDEELTVEVIREQGFEGEVVIAEQLGHYEVE